MSVCRGNEPRDNRSVYSGPACAPPEPCALDISAIAPVKDSLLLRGERLHASPSFALPRPEACES